MEIQAPLSMLLAAFVLPAGRLLFKACAGVPDLLTTIVSFNKNTSIPVKLEFRNKSFSFVRLLFLSI